jgi:hypothetical protein
MYRPCWGEDRVFFHHDDGRLTSIPALWTSLGAVDPFVWLAAGRAYFRVEDLIAVADLVEAVPNENYILAMKSPFSDDAAPISSSN